MMELPEGTLSRISRVLLHSVGPAVAFLALNPLVFPSVAAQQTTTFAFDSVTVIDVADGRLLPEQMVVISGNRIQAVGSTGSMAIPAGTQVIQAAGKYLIPGLWDMHTHVDEDNERYPRYIAHGVTGLREMGQRFRGGIDTFRIVRQAIMAGTRIGPRLVGPSIDVSQGPYRLETRTTAGIASAVDSFKAAGVAFLKYHERYGDPDLFFMLLREARRAGLPVVGHIPREAGNVAASDSGMRSVEHADENHDCIYDRPRDTRQPGAGRRTCPAMVQAYVRNGTWMTPTAVFAFTPPITNPAHRARARSVVKAVYDLGFRRFLTGSDASARNGVSRTPPGFSILHEIMLLAEFALSPLEAIQAATINPARYFDATDSLGTVASGKVADLVLLDANPLTDIHNILTIRAVVANGRYFSRAALDVLDPEGVRHAEDYRAAIARHGRLPRGGTIGVEVETFAQPSGIDGVRGLRVEAVSPALGAETAGIAPDDIIVAVNGVSLRRDDDLKAQARLWEPGMTIAVDIVRNGTFRTVNVEVGES